MSSNGGVATAKHGGGAAGDDPALGSRGGGPRRALDRRAFRSGAPLITFDMGGTSADIGIVDGGPIHRGQRPRHLDRRLSAARLDDRHPHHRGRRGLHRPRGSRRRASGSARESAGAEPGPAAYGRGGTEPTVTDANVVLGRLAQGTTSWAARWRLDEAPRPRAAIGRLAETARALPEREAAEGVLTIVTSNMANAIRSRTVQKGIDPREYSLVAFGGAGPLHAVDVAARSWDSAEVIVPPLPGHHLRDRPAHHGSSSYDTMTHRVPGERRSSTSARLNRRSGYGDGVGADRAPVPGRRQSMRAEVTVRCARGDLRYVGQGYELRIPIFRGETSGRRKLSSICSERFHAQHRGGVRPRLRRESRSRSSTCG